uniref:Peptidyl-prolyl cis-trans isomerase n=1 Tax=Minutocellus polymorphus TaxID=265543 RepID=A0A6U0JBT0_9STRA|eukprot:CAMPEP_0197725494 /NCGR_PEP_ID=MMETSP1434-20131217/7004_1 /TAXON_ID=265543 /ORGANISM="Minutocellus polymorphus, Strain CCMP3303" /LENGTH=264 /DNA_ID=CAMNT_0043310971 /DNA_START=6 /DNA_END=800 /DNA_ORIENTATION=-
MSTDGTAVPPADGDDAAAATPSIASMLERNPPPDALAPGWVMRRSRHKPSTCYYYNQDSGVSRWDPPRALATAAAPPPSSSAAAPPAGDPAAAPSILKRSAPSSSGGTGENDPNAASAENGASASAEGRKQSQPAKKHRPSSSSKPDQVRALHILKKHRGSRRPASWRRPKITDTKEKAIADVEELIAILKESEDDPKELRATFEELAKTESDCTSAKRGGDLGFFGKRKMQKPFEDASFALGIGELSGVVETSSGVHVILRIG